MASELSSEFKLAFGRMLVGLKMQYSIPNALNYSQTLYEYTRGGLYMMGKIGPSSDDKSKKEYEQALQECEVFYKNALACLRIRGRENIVQERMLSACFEINKRLFPIALKEGILKMNEEMFGVMDTFLNPSATVQDEHRRKH